MSVAEVADETGVEAHTHGNPEAGTNPDVNLAYLEGDGTAFDDLTSLSLEELLSIKITTGSKTESTIDEAAVSISVVTREDIVRWGYETVAEVLQHALSFYLIDDHILPNTGVGGIAGGLLEESGSIKLMINGSSVSFRSTSGNWLGPELVPMSAIERIEIVRGATSAIYGADAFLGVVNIILRSGHSGGEIRTAGFSTEKRSGGDVDLGYFAEAGPFELFVAGRLRSEDRSGVALPSSSPAPSVPSFRRKLTASKLLLESKVGIAGLTVRINENHKLSLSGSTALLDRGAEFASWSQLSKGIDDSGRWNQTWISLYQSWLRLGAEFNFSEDVRLELSATYFEGGPTSRDRVEVLSDVYYVRRNFGYHTVESNAEVRWRILANLTTVAGAELIADLEKLPTSDRVLKLYRAGIPPGGVVLRGERSDNLLLNIGAFVQTQWTPWRPHIGLFGAARYDHHSIYGGQFSGRVGVTSTPVDMLNFKLLYGTSFKAPSPLLLYAQPFGVGDVIGNPDLKPQQVHTVEGQAAITPIDFLRITTGLSYSFLLNRAEFAPTGFHQTARNLSEIRSLSWNTEAMAQYSDFINSYARFELHHIQRSNAGEGYRANLVGTDNVIYPSWVLRAGVTVTVAEAYLRFGAEGLFVGPRRASETNIIANGASYELAPYVWLDATISTVGLELIGERRTSLTIKARNILDVKGPDPGYAGVDYPLAPRRLMIQLRQQL